MTLDATPVDTTSEEQPLAELSSSELQSIKRKSVSGVVSYLARTVFLQGIGLAAIFLLSSRFSPEDFGVFGYVSQIIGLLVFFSDVGLAAALIQKKDEPTLDEYRTAFTVQQALSWLIVAIVAVLLSTGFIQEKTGMAGVWILVCLALSFPLATLKTIPSIMLERRLEFSRLVVPQIFEQIAFYGVLVTLAWMNTGAIAYAYAIAARSLIGVLVMWLIKPWRLGFAWDKSALKQLLNFGAKFQLNDLLARVKDQLFFLYIGNQLPLNQFGYIQWAKNWSQYPYNLTVNSVMAITFPTFSRLQGSKLALQRAIEKSLFFITLAIFPILVGMCVFIGPLTTLIPSYAKWQPALLSFTLFTLSIGFAALSTPLVNTLNAIGHINQSLKLMVMWTALTWIVTPLLLSRYGYDGVAMAAMAIALTSVIPIFYVKKIVPLQVWDQVWRQLLAAMLMAAVGVSGLSYWSQSLWWLLVGMGASTGAYGGALLALGWTKLHRELVSLRQSK